MANKVGIGIIGTGFARRVQIPAFLSCANAAIASVSSGSLGNARSAAEEFGIGHFTDDWRATVEYPSVQLVCITTPPALHKEMALFAIQNGKHVLCEKPMAMTLAEAEVMADAAAAGSGIALIDHELRFQPGRIKARSMLQAGAVGKVRHAKWIFRAPHRGDPDVPWNWWSDATQGGGALGAIASHVIDTLHWMLGSDVSSVSCQLHTNIKHRRDSSGVLHDVTSDDESNMLLRFADSELTEDATGLISISMVEGPQYENTLFLYGSDGAMRVDAAGEVFTAARGLSEWNAVPVEMAPPLPGVMDTGFAAAFTAFVPRLVDAVHAGEKHVENAATFGDGVRVQRVLDAARRSNAEARAVQL